MQLGRPQLTWEEVLDYTFLSDFELLRDARRDVRSEPWAQPAGRLALDQYHKLIGSEVEIIRLNKEIHSLVTYMHEETAYISLKVEEVRRTDPLLAVQIHKYGWERGRCKDMHLLRLHKLARLDGFTGSLTPGRGALYSKIQGMMATENQPSSLNDRDNDKDAPPPEEDPDEEEEELAELVTVLRVCGD